jgi:ParB family chromosome partitioning protein
MSLKKKAAAIDLKALVSGVTHAPLVPASGSGAPGMTAIGMHAETVYRDRKIADDNRALTLANAELANKLERFAGCDVARRLDPKVIRHSNWANRDAASFNTPAFADLKDEIQSAGGNIQPIKVRPIPGIANEFEVVFGHRRHRACLELGIDVLAVIEELDDAGLFAQMDRENRLRADLRPYEQGQMYLKALNSGLFSSMRSMCSAVGADPGSVSKLVALAKLPSDVLAAFQSPLDIQYQWGALLGAALQKDPDLVLARARTFATQNPRPSAQVVFKSLVADRLASDSSGSGSTTAYDGPILLKGSGGRSGKISFDQKRGVIDISLNGLDSSRLREIEKVLKPLLA